ncbi:hypothetical protein [uncultured Sulfitobacter sp.]|uniref:hypothetical protein n=1 Tax=uncultured Sulfitobacter sp. TaxID=191468 RepID=UPI00260B7DC9|nr:hypothetical protein [uncultured Sulfitobacter sp.]
MMWFWSKRHDHEPVRKRVRDAAEIIASAERQAAILEKKREALQQELFAEIESIAQAEVKSDDV